MSSTDELRRLLDERGVEWQAPNSCQRDEITQFRVGGDFGGTWWEAYEMSDGTFQMSSEIYDELTPEQAIAATLDAETLQAENAKLRELLSESLMDYKLYAEKYGLQPYISDVNEHLDARMRELGVEV